MIQLSINLPTKRRLDLSLVKRRKSFDETPLFPDMGKIRRTRRGNKISRYFRHIFEHNKLKKFLGTNLAILAITSTFIPQNHPFHDEIQETVIAQAPDVFKTEVSIQYPTVPAIITQEYRFYHPGIDFDGITGDVIRPIMAGKVEGIEYSKFGYGNAVLVNHGEGIASFYAHLSKISIQKEDEVTTESKLGEMGTTGRAYGDHLHLEVYENGRPINPVSILP